MKRGHLMPVAGVALAALLIFILLNRPARPDSFEGLQTQLFDHARRVSVHLRFHTASSYFDGKFHAARLRDLNEAADAGRLVKRVGFARQEPVDYGGIRIEMQQWAATNQAQIIFTSTSTQGLILYVRASDEERVQSYLNSLTMDDLNPFE
jgi:hypothetical protein